MDAERGEDVMNFARASRGDDVEPADARMLWVEKLGFDIRVVTGGMTLEKKKAKIHRWCAESPLDQISNQSRSTYRDFGFGVDRVRALLVLFRGEDLQGLFTGEGEAGHEVTWIGGGRRSVGCC